MNVTTIFLILLLQVYEHELKGVAIFAGRVHNPTTVLEPFGPSDEKNYYTSYNVHKASYGTSFGRNGLASNTHIYGDNYKVYDSRNYKFLVEYLFNRVNTNGWKSESKLGEWSETDDRQWRSTTKSPYFMNKVPRAENLIPATAVVGE